MDDGTVQCGRDQGKIRFDAFSLIEFTRPPDQYFGYGSKNPPVPLFIGVGQIGAGDSSTKTQMILCLRTGLQTGHDIAQTFPVGELSKAQSQKMIIGTEGTGTAGHGKSIGATSKLGLIEERGKLRKHGGLGRHMPTKPRSALISTTNLKTPNA